MKLVFFGTSEFAVPSLRLLHGSDYTFVACVTRPERPQGRGLRVSASPVKQAAEALHIPLFQPERLRDPATLAWLRDHPADWYIVIAFGAILPTELLAIPQGGALSLHPSLLPQYRGAAPIARALLRGETTTGVTVFRVRETVDAGEIASQQSVTIAPEETAEELSTRLADLGARQLLETIHRLNRGLVIWQPQDDSLATMAPKLTKADGLIDWTRSAAAIHHQVRALVPWPGAMTSWQGKPLRILRSRVVSASSTGAAPGTVASVTREEAVIATGEGGLLLMEVQQAGGARMAIAEFLRGHRLAVGDRLGMAA